ncbi:MAG: PAS domain S-box protein [Desulfobacula sp.]|nr:PAS domain S-box protein [Desulfobacula sp.]
MQLYISYKSGLDSIVKSIRQVERTYLDGIIKSLWISDTELLQTQIDGMMKLPDMQYVGVVQDKKSIAEAGIIKDKNVITEEFSLPYTYQDKTISLGTLRVVYTLENIYSRMITDAFVLILSQSIAILLISCFIFFIFYRLVARHLYELVNYARSLSVDTLETPFTLKRDQTRWGEDEFDELTKSINLMRSNLKDSYSRLEGEVLERKQAQKALQESETHLRTLINALPDLVWLKDSDGVYLSCNAKFERLFGAGEAQIKGKTDYDFLDRSLADFFREKDRLAIEIGEPSMNEEEITYADDGHTEILETIKNPMYDEKGNLIGVLGVGRDITARKKAEKEKIRLKTELQQAQKMEAVGRLAGGVAHDFNNMLSIILGNTDIILEDLNASDPVINNLREIHKAAERSADLTRQLLAFARKQTIAPKVLNLNTAIEDMVKMLKRLIGEDIDLIWKPSDALWKIKIDPSQIDQVLVNFCVNSRDAIKSVGKVTIETENVSFDMAYCLEHDGFKPGDYVMMAFSDDGAGMDRDTLANIFEPFFTTKEMGQGTGLGLATIYGIVKQNNGFINVYSEPGQGTTFKVYFPRHEASCMETKAVEPEIKKGNAKILLVEDEISILKTTATMLERLGYKVLSASTPGEAIQMAGDLGPDDLHLLITDVVMPEMNGRDLVEKICRLHPDIKCLFMSGYTANVIAHHGILDEGIEFINKPFSRQELASKIWEALH